MTDNNAQPIQSQLRHELWQEMLRARLSTYCVLALREKAQRWQMFSNSFPYFILLLSTLYILVSPLLTMPSMVQSISLSAASVIVSYSALWFREQRYSQAVDVKTQILHKLMTIESLLRQEFDKGEESSLTRQQFEQLRETFTEIDKEIAAQPLFNEDSESYQQLVHRCWRRVLQEVGLEPTAKAN